MSEEKVNVQKAKKGVHVIGMFNGWHSFQTKNGVVTNAVLVLPNIAGCIEVRIKSDTDVNSFKMGEDVHMMVNPTFYNGRVSGFEAV